MATPNGAFVSDPNADSNGFFSFLGPVLQGIGVGITNASGGAQTPVWGQAGSVPGSGSGYPNSPVSQTPNGGTTGTLSQSVGIGTLTVGSVVLLGAIGLVAIMAFRK